MSQKRAVIPNLNEEENEDESTVPKIMDVQDKIVLRMLKNDLSHEMIMKCTGLSKTEIEKIRNRN